MKILVTGGAGFIGSNFIRHMLLECNDVEIVNFDKLTYSGNLENLADLAENSRYQFVRGDITDATSVAEVMAQGLDAIVNFAAETHVDRSIENAAPFLHSNVMGTLTVLEAVRKFRIKLFIQISTEEVYRSDGANDSFTEDQVLDARSPYSASKAAADHL